MELAELAPRLEAEVERRLSPKRATHSMGVAIFTAQLCERHGLEPLKGRVAGLSHDLCKEMKVKEQLRLFQVFRSELEPGLERGLGFVPGHPSSGPAAAEAADGPDGADGHDGGDGLDRADGPDAAEGPDGAESPEAAKDSPAFFHESLIHGPAAAALLWQEWGLDDPDILEAVAWHTTGRPGMPPLAVFLYCADKIEPGRKHVDEAFRRRCLGLAPEDMLLAVVENSLAWLRKKEWEIAPQTLLLYNALRKPVNAQ